MRIRVGHLYPDYLNIYADRGNIAVLARRAAARGHELVVDAVSVGDYHLPHLVSWCLVGEPRGSDDRMLELLEPFRGHRGRVLRLLEASGMTAPRYGPRMPLRNIAAS